MSAAGPNPPPVVAVLSQYRAGHILAYHRLYADRFARQGCRVVEILPPARTGLLERLVRQAGRIGWVLGARTWRRAARDVRAAERAGGCRVDAAFLVYLDVGFLNAAVGPGAIDRWFPRPWAGVSNAPAAVAGAVSAYPGRERGLAAAGCRAVVVTDDSFAEPCRAAWPGRRVLVMPEIADLSAPGRCAGVGALTAFARGRRLVGLLGVISAKKNVEAFLALARAAQRARPDVAFFLAGDFSARACPGPERRRLQRVLADLPENCRLFPAPIPDGPEFNAWVEACAVVWIAYRDIVHKSNVLTKAAHFRKPVIVSAGGHVMAVHARRYGLGEAVDAGDTPATLAALERLLAGTGAEPHFAAFDALNSSERLDETVAGLLEAFRT